MRYVYSCLAEATYTCVAERDGKVVGVIIGQAKSDYRISHHLAYGANAIRCSLNMKQISHGTNSGMNDFKNLHHIYHIFSQKHKGEFDGVLTLFAVDKDRRGFGLGKSLLSSLLNYLRSQKTSRIYLYTDTTCNFGFYEHHGFQRLEAQSMNLLRDKKPFRMDVFLYGYLLADT